MLKQKSKRLLCLLLSLTMVLSLSVVSVYADNTGVTEPEAIDAVAEEISETVVDVSDDALTVVSEDVGTVSAVDANAGIMLLSDGEDANETTTCVAKIGESAYSTVSDAIAAVESNGTITLTGNVSEASITVLAGKTITLDLNGHTLTLTGGTTYTDTGYTGSTFRASLVNQGTLTIQNGSLVGNGTYTTDNTNYYYVQNMILNTGTLDIESGVTVTGKLYTITNVGGTVTTAGDITATYCDAIVTYGGAITVDGGTITATNSSYYGSAIDIFDRNYNRPTSDDGTGATVTINDGTIKAYCYGFSTNNQLSGYSKLNIYGGTIETVFACIYWPTPGTITIGTADSESDNTPYLLNTGGSGIVICCGTLNVYSGTIEASYDATASTPFDSTTWAANYRSSSGMVGLADAISVIANRSSAYAEYPLEINLEGGTYISASNYAVRYLNCNAASDSDTDTAQNISVELSGGTYTGGETLDGTAVAAIDTCEYEDTSNISTLTVTGGSYSSDVSEYTTDTSAAVANSDGTYSVVETVENAVAVVYDAGGTYVGSYTSLSSAYTAVKKYTGGTIYLTDDISGEKIKVTSDVTFTLDLNGNKLDSQSNVAVLVQSSGASVTIKDSADNGEITSSCTTAVIYSTAGTIKIESGKISGTATSASLIRAGGTDADITINGGIFSGYYIFRIDSGSVAVNGGTFTADDSGNIVYDVDESAELTITDGWFNSSSAFRTSGDSISVSGGYFTVSDSNKNRLSNYIPAGYTVVTEYVDGTSWYTVGKSNFTVEYVEDGGIKIRSSHTTLDAALRAAQSGDTIVMNADSTSGIKLSSDISVTLDLNGYTLSETNADSYVVGVVSGSLTIIDSSEGGTGIVTGSISESSSSSITGIVRNMGGTLKIESGTIKADSGYAVNTYGGTTTISGGYVNGDVTSNSTFTITGGYFTSDPSDYVETGYVSAKTTDDTYTYTVLSVVLGTSGSDSTEVTATSISGFGTNTLYVGVSASDISNYSTEKYPTTGLTYTVSEGSNDSGGYIFAGWYTGSDGTYTAMETFPKSDGDTTGATVYYAKFVDANVLSVQCIITKGVTDYDSSTNYWRLLTSVDTFDYNDIGFKVAIGSETTNLEGKLYYYVMISAANKAIYTSDFSSASQYVATSRYTDSYATITSMDAQAYWITLDGTTVYGASKTFTTTDDFYSVDTVTATQGTSVDTESV